MADWNEMEARYVTGDVTYRQLAAAYGVCLRTLERHGKKDAWAQKRRRHRQSVYEAVLEADRRDRVDRIAKLCLAGDALLERVQELTAAADISPGSLKTLSETLKNIRDAQMLKESAGAEQDKKVITVVLDEVQEFVL